MAGIWKFASLHLCNDVKSNKVEELRIFTTLIKIQCLDKMDVCGCVCMHIWRVALNHVRHRKRIARAINPAVIYLLLIHLVGRENCTLARFQPHSGKVEFAMIMLHRPMGSTRSGEDDSILPYLPPCWSHLEIQLNITHLTGGRFNQIIVLMRSETCRSLTHTFTLARSMDGWPIRFLCHATHACHTPSASSRVAPLHRAHSGPKLGLGNSAKKKKENREETRKKFFAPKIRWQPTIKQQ